MLETCQRKIDVKFYIADILEIDNVKCDFDRITNGDEKYMRSVRVET